MVYYKEDITSTSEAIGFIANKLCDLRRDRYRLNNHSEEIKDLQNLADKWNVPFSYNLCVNLMDEMYERAEWDSSSEYCGF